LLKKAVFIDRDGTINVEKGYVHKVADFELIPGAEEALQLLTKAGVKIYIVTNQAGIAKGLFTEADFHRLTDYMLDCFCKKSIKVERVLYCPHHPNGVIPQYAIHCRCRKPNTLLIENTIKDHGYTRDELALIGDKKTDIDAGMSLGIDTYLVLTGYGKEQHMSVTADFVAPNLLNAVQHILQRMPNNKKTEHYNESMHIEKTD